MNCYKCIIKTTITDNNVPENIYILEQSIGRILARKFIKLLI